MSGIRLNIMGNTKKQEQTPTHFQEIKHSRKPECEVTQMLEPSDRDIRITMINMLKELVEKVDSMPEQMEMWKIRNVVSEMKNSFDRLNSKLNTAEERMNELGR